MINITHTLYIHTLITQHGLNRNKYEIGKFLTVDSVGPVTVSTGLL